MSYGHDGAGVYLPRVSAERPWQFARSHGHGYRFYDIGSTRTMIPPVRLISESKSKRKKHQMYSQLLHSAASDVFVPSDLMASYAFESSTIASSNGYDPIQGALMDIGTVISNGDNEYGSKAIAYAEGQSGGMDLCLASLDFVRKPFLQGEGDDGSLQAKLPMVRGRTSIEMHSPIQQIQFAPNPEPSVCPYTLVRTNMGTDLIRASLQKDEGLGFEFEYGPHIPLEKVTETTAGNQVHATFSSWDWTQTAVIDSIGSWGIYQIGNSGNMEKIYTGGIHSNDQQHISRWNRLLWGASMDSIMIANRRHVRYHDLRSNESIELLTDPSDLMQICDISPSPLNDNENFVLTSDQLVWTDVRVPGKKLLSWDHFLHSKDPSLKLSMCGVNGVAMASLYSRLLPANVVYQFTQSNGLPISADDPYYYVTSPDSVTQCLKTFKLSLQEENSMENDVEDEAEVLFDESDVDGDDNRPKVLCCMRFSTEYGLYRHILSTDKDSRLESRRKRIEISESEADDFIPSHSDALYGDDYINTGKKTKDVYLYDFRSVYESVFDIENQLPPPSTNTTEDDEQVTAFAETLNSAIKTSFKLKKRQIFTLGELAVPQTLINDLNAVSSMVEDLQEHYSRTKISVFPLTYGLNTLFDEKVKNIADIYEHLVNLWVKPLDAESISQSILTQRKNVCRYMATELALSCMGYHGTINENDKEKDKPEEKINFPVAYLSKYSDSITKSKTQISRTVDLLLSEWPDEETSDTFTYRPLGNAVEEEPEPIQRMLDSSYIPPPPSLSQPASLPATFSQRSSQTSPVGAMSLGSPKARRFQSSHSQKLKKKKRTQGF